MRHPASRGAELPHASYRPGVHGVRSSTASGVDVPRLLGLVGRIKVRELARLAEMSVGRLAALVVRASGVASILVPGDAPIVRRHLEAVPRAPRKCRGIPSSVRPAEGWEPPTSPPALEKLLGHTTLRELAALIDHWAIAVVLHQEAWNVTHAAARLGVPRRNLRIRWARVRDQPTQALAGDEARRPSLPPDLPAPPSLAGMLADGVRLVDIRRAARQWLVVGTCQLVHGNRTLAARILGTTRRRVREDLARYAAERELGSGG